MRIINDLESSKDLELLKQNTVRGCIFCGKKSSEKIKCACEDHEKEFEEMADDIFK